MFVKRFIKDYMIFTSSETYLQRANLNCFQECAKFGSKKVHTEVPGLVKGGGEEKTNCD